VENQVIAVTWSDYLLAHQGLWVGRRPERMTVVVRQRRHGAPAEQLAHDCDPLQHLELLGSRRADISAWIGTRTTEQSSTH
jgi:hypothetical protein